MEPKFRPRRLIILTMLLIIVGGSAYGYYRWKKNTTSPRYFGQRAEAAIVAKDWPVAVHYLQKLLEVDRKNDTARIMLANVYRRASNSESPEDVDQSTLTDPPKSIPLLRQVAAHQFYNTEVRGRLLRSYIFFKDNDSAKVIAHELLDLRSGNIEAVNFLANDLLETKYWEDADQLMSDIAWNVGAESPIYLRLMIRVLYARGQLDKLDKLLAKTLSAQADKPAQQLTQLSDRELRLYDNVLMSTLRSAKTPKEAEIRLLQALDVLHKMVLVSDVTTVKVQLVEAALDLIEEFKSIYPPPKRRLKFARRAGVKPSIHDAAAARALKIAAPLVESGEANAKIYELVARAAIWVEDESRSITLLREGLRVYEELPPDLRSELLSLHRDAALEMIARHDLGDGKVAPLMKNAETQTIGHLLGGALALDRHQFKTAREYVLKAREDEHLTIAADALLLRILMASRDWKAALALAATMDDTWSKMPASNREWLTKTQGGHEATKLIRAFCQYKMKLTKELVKTVKQLDGTQFQSKARLLQIADLVRARKTEEASKLVREARTQEPANFDLIMANVGLLVESKQTQQALQLIGSYVTAFPEDVRGQVVFAQWLSMHGQNQQAQALLTQTMQQFPDEPAARLMTAELLFASGRNAELNKLLRSIRRPQTANMILLLATMFELRRLGFDEAADGLLEGAPGMPSNSNQALANATTAFANQQLRSGFEKLAETINIRPTRNPPRSVYLQELNKALQHSESADRDKDIEALAKKYPTDKSILLIASELAVRRGDLRDALLHVGKLEMVDKVVGRADFTRAKILKLAGRTEAALNTLKDVFAEIPQHQQARLMAARLAFELKNYQSSLDHLAHVSEEALQSTEMLFMRSEILTQLDRTQEAEPLLAAYVRREPNKDDARVNLALLMKSHGRLNEAIQFLGQALLRMPNSRKMQTTYLDLLAEAGKLPELEKATRQFTNDKPDGNMALRLAGTFVTAGQFDSAKEWLAQAKSQLRGESHLEVSYLEGLIALEKGKRSGYHNFFVQAKTKFDYVLKKKPQHRSALRHALELSLFRFNELASAVHYATNLRKTVLTRRLTERDVDGIAEAYRQTGRLDEALDVVVSTLKRLPNSGVLRFQYGAVLLEKADTDEHRELAKQQLQAAIQIGVPNHHLAELNAMMASFDKENATTEEPETAASTEAKVSN
jgi:thioredoxin-like negative regulator of GroEL